MCKSNSECCSSYCSGIPAWEYGVCKEGESSTVAVSKPGVTNAPEINTVGAGIDETGSLTSEQFVSALTINGYPAPNRDQYETLVKLAPTAGAITSKQELAMFLAQILWESGGLKYKKEIACTQTSCPNDYRTGREKPGKYYYGRGYIQLTWLYNYDPCSKDLYGDDRLVENPDLVSDTEEGAWGSAFWYWKKNVHSIPDVQKGYFGAATMAINGGLECRGPHRDKARKRFEIYTKVLKAFELNYVKPNETGCY